MLSTFYLILLYLRYQLLHNLPEVLLGLAGVALLIVGLHYRARRYPSVINSHWGQLIEGFHMSPLEFYRQLDEAIEKRQIPASASSRIDWPEWGAFSARREYFRIRRKRLVFDVCAAHFGTGFFVSWWLGETLSVTLYLINLVPLLGPFLVQRILRATYYRLDTEAMFQTAVHAAVLEVVDNITDSKGIPRLSETERKPVLREFFQR